MAPTILVIEDNPMNLELVGEVLVAAGMSVIGARNGQEGLKLALQQQPHLILLDIRLPGLDGYGVLQRLKADPVTSTIPVIALTAQAMVGDKEQALSAGFDHYIPKPVDTRALPGEIRSLLGRNGRANK